MDQKTKPSSFFLTSTSLWICLEKLLPTLRSIMKMKPSSSYCKENLVLQTENGKSWSSESNVSSLFSFIKDALQIKDTENAKRIMIFKHSKNLHFTLQIFDEDCCKIISPQLQTPPPPLPPPPLLPRSCKDSPSSVLQKEPRRSKTFIPKSMLEFDITLSRTATANKYILCIPQAVTRLMEREKSLPGMVTIFVRGKKWQIKMGRFGASVRQSAGFYTTAWKHLVIENNLRKGDKCLFKMIGKTYWAFEVTVIRNQAAKKCSSVEPNKRACKKGFRISHFAPDLQSEPSKPVPDVLNSGSRTDSRKIALEFEKQFGWKEMTYGVYS